MFRNVHIVGVGTYNPQKRVDNDYFIHHFKKYDMHEHVENLVKKLGRKIRTQAGEKESSITMAVEAAKKALESAKLTSKDVDMIISATDTPEYLMPSCSLMIRNKLKAENACSVFDLNNNCIGMINAMDVASRYLKTDKKYKRVLVVGSVLVSPFAREDDMVTYSIVGDGAAAVILEVMEEKEVRGILGSRMYTDDNYNETIRFPACGLLNISKDDFESYHRKMEWKPFDFSFLSEKWAELIINLLKENDYTPKDVSHYFMSQFSKEDIRITLEKLGSVMQQATFIGDKYGYTGSASPIMALDDKIKKETFKKDEVVVFCSVAAGYTMQALAYKW